METVRKYIIILSFYTSTTPLPLADHSYAAHSKTWLERITISIHLCETPIAWCSPVIPVRLKRTGRAKQEIKLKR